MKHFGTSKPVLLSAALAILSATHLAGVTPARAASQRAEHSVSWYAVHPTVRQNILHQCDDDRSLDNNGDCRNATAAAAQTATDGSVNGHDAFAANNTVAAYKANGPAAGDGACRLQVKSASARGLVPCRSASRAGAAPVNYTPFENIGTDLGRHIQRRV